jgi:tetratricopeptide (TPR) repeat protein
VTLPGAATARLASTLFVLAVLVCVVYWPGLNGGFVFDDMPNIVNNTQLHVRSTLWADWMSAIFSSPASSLQRPLAMLSFAINHFFTGLNPWPMKLTNVAIHMVNTALVFFLVRALLRSLETPARIDDSRNYWATVFVAAAWALHPINLMAVLFVVQRMESLSHTFVFAGLWLYVSARQKQMAGTRAWLQLLASLTVFTAIGLLSKESAVLLPLYAFLIEFCLFHFRGSNGNADNRLKWLFALILFLPATLALAWLLPASMQESAYHSREFSLVERLLTEFRVVLDYLHWTVLPNLNQLSLYHDDYVVSKGFLSPASTLLAMLAEIAVILFAWLVRRSRPLTSLGIFWFFGAQALTGTFIPLELMFEHRNYFASLGICLVLADLLILLPIGARSRQAGALLAGFLAFFYASGTYLRASEWDHPVHFVGTEVAKHPQSPRATYELARMLVVLSDYKKDSPQLMPAMDAIERARLAPGSTILPAQAALIVAARTGQDLRPVWWSDLVHKLERKRVGQQSLGALQSMVTCSNKRECNFPPNEMIRVFGAAMSHGDNPELYNIYGSYALNSLGDVDLALRLWTEAARVRPKEPQYHVNLARLLIVLGRDDEARKQISELRRIGRFGQYESTALELESDLRKRVRPTTVKRPP